MTYFKVIENGVIVDAGCTFLKWSSDRHRMYICDVNEGQFVQSYNEQNVYKDEWMKQSPSDAPQFPLSDVVIISKSEYDDIITLLGEGETIEVVEEPVITIPVEPKIEPEEKPMTIAQMREIILEQQKQIDTLMEKLG